MAKRFTDTDLYEREWFQELSPKMKCFWDYVCKRCDYAGMWNVNLRLASFQIGVKITESEVVESFGNRIVYIEEDKLFIPGFIKFQYGKVLSENSTMHKSVMKLLDKYGLIDDNGVVKIPNIEPNKNNVVEITNDKPIKAERFKKPTEKEVVEYFVEKGSDKEEGKSFWNFYESKGWVVGKSPMKNWHSAVSNWLRGKTKGSVQRVNERAYIEQGQKEKDHGW